MTAATVSWEGSLRLHGDAGWSRRIDPVQRGELLPGNLIH
jgi:hypothetical protein